MDKNKLKENDFFTFHVAERQFQKGKMYRYTSFIIITVICLLICSFYLLLHNHAGKIYEEEMRSTVINLKKTFLKSTVNNLIHEIGKDREIEALRYKSIVDDKYEALEYSKTLPCNNFMQSFILGLRPIASQSEAALKWTVLVWNAQGKALYDPDRVYKESIDYTLQTLTPLLSHYRIVTHDESSYLFGVLKTCIDDAIKSATAEKIKCMQLENDSYIWVNEVLNYEGGDDYAIRRIHPNLPETEGMLLSTHMTDAQGRHPYLIELDGVNQYGEVFFSYDFKELNSDKVSEKLSYAKLYKEFDWIIAAGIQNNEMEKYILQASESSAETIYTKTIQLLIVLLAVVLVSIALMLFLEKQNFRRSKNQLEHEISFDPLTNAKSRRFGMHYLERIYEDYQDASIKPLVAIMVFDIDGFKRINDRYGHCEGDRVLQEIVSAVYRNIRASDILIRFGGDEFVGVFQGISEENTNAFASKILDAIASIEFSAASERVKLSISIGFSHIREGDTEFMDALNRADRAMYLSKSDGGNRVTLL